jgi:hypothetical protein
MGAWRVLPYYLRGKEDKTRYKGHWLATMRLKAEFAAGHRTVAFAASLGHGRCSQDYIGGRFPWVAVTGAIQTNHAVLLARANRSLRIAVQSDAGVRAHFPRAVLNQATVMRDAIQHALYLLPSAAASRN